ncbi:MAG: sigma-70 family RNA polymerase sigma factor [Acidimicrobiales bacterium]
MGAVDELTSLALAAGGGDRAALASFVRTTQADVWRLCAHLSDRDQADDLTQEVYLRAIPALGRFRGEAPARLWLLSIARRTCADGVRRRRRYRGLVDRLRASERDTARAPAGADPLGHIAIDALVRTLPTERRDAFVLTQVLGLSYGEAARVCSCPVGTIRSRVARARGDLIAGLGGRAAAEI